VLVEGSVGRERSTAPGISDAKEGDLLDAAYAAAPVALGLLDADLRFIKANHLFARFDGVEPAEHVGRRINDVAPSIGPRLEPLIRGVLESGQHVLGVNFHSEQESGGPGTAHWLVSCYPLRRAAGDVAGVCVMLENITGRRVVEAAAKESEERARRLLDAVIGMDPNGNVTEWNQQAELMFGWTSDEAVGSLLAELVIPNSLREAHRTGLARFLETGEAPILGRTVELIAVRRNGEEFPAELTVTGSQLEERWTFTAFVRDISARVASERALADRAEDLHRLAEQRQWLLDALVSAQEDERARVARELHDGLGQVLTSIALFAADLSLGDIPDAQKEKLDRFGDRVQKAIGDMRQLVWSLRPVELDDEGLVPALDRLLAQIREREGMAADLVAEIGDERLTPGIEATVYRVVQEAVTNALRHGGATNVSVVLTRRAGVLTVIVEDDGRGFDVAVRSGGFGMLGMRERAALAGGSLLVDSSPGVGTTVRLEVPLQK
jgi:PAS domain S-box-containing protein